MDIALQDAQSEWFWTESTEALIGGAAGPGKSFFIRVASIFWAFEIPGLQTYIFRRTYKDLEANHINHPQGYPSLLGEHIAHKSVKYNTSKNIFTFSNGSMIHLCHCQHEKDVLNYQGAEIHLLLIDEGTHFTAKIYKFLRGRVRMSGIDLPDKYKIEDLNDSRGYRTLFPRILMSANPGGVGHNWIKNMFVDYQPYKQISKTPDTEGGMYRAYYPARVQDNPKLLEDDPQYINRLKGLGSPDLVRAMLNGDWDIVAGGAIDDLWTRDKHVIEPFKIPRTWLVDRGYDWGSSKPAACIFFAESDGTEIEISPNVFKTYPRGTIFIISEIYFSNGEPNVGNKLLATEHAEIILEREKELNNFHGCKVQPGPADNAIFDSINGNCIADDMSNMGCDWTKSDKSPGSRKQGLEKLRELLKKSLSEPQEEPGLYIFNNCINTIRTLPTLPRDEKKPDDIDTNAEDHIYDVIRYRITNKRAYIESFNHSFI